MKIYNRKLLSLILAAGITFTGCGSQHDISTPKTTKNIDLPKLSVSDLIEKDIEENLIEIVTTPEVVASSVAVLKTPLTVTSSIVSESIEEVALKEEVVLEEPENIIEVIEVPEVVSSSIAAVNTPVVMSSSTFQTKDENKSMTETNEYYSNGNLKKKTTIDVVEKETITTEYIYNVEGKLIRKTEKVETTNEKDGINSSILEEVMTSYNEFSDDILAIKRLSVREDRVNGELIAQNTISSIESGNVKYTTAIDQNYLDNNTTYEYMLENSEKSEDAYLLMIRTLGEEKTFSEAIFMHDEYSVDLSKIEAESYKELFISHQTDEIMSLTGKSK